MLCIDLHLHPDSDSEAPVLHLVVVAVAVRLELDTLRLRSWELGWVPHLVVVEADRMLVVKGVVAVVGLEVRRRYIVVVVGGRFGLERERCTVVGRGEADLIALQLSKGLRSRQKHCTVNLGLGSQASRMRS